MPPQPSEAPQALPVQSGAQTQVPLLQTSPVGQVPFLQMPPQPSEAPQALPEQSGAQTQVPLLQVWPEGQVPHLQVPPQPSESPQLLPEQLGMQRHLPFLQVLPAGQEPILQVPPQPLEPPQVVHLGTHCGELLLPTQESKQIPSLQNSPGLQVTPTHLLTMQVPLTQVLPVAQVTPAQASLLHGTREATLPFWQPSLGTSSTSWHLPSDGEQYLSSPQTTPLQGTSKQPLVQ